MNDKQTLKEVKRICTDFRQKMVWTSDYARFLQGEYWVDEYDAFINPEIERVECDCEDLMLSDCRGVHERGLLLPEDHGYSVVLTAPGKARGGVMDHARSWFRIGDKIYYGDCNSARGFYERGHGPHYADEVKYSFYSNPLEFRNY